VFNRIEIECFATPHLKLLACVYANPSNLQRDQGFSDIFSFYLQ